MKVDPNDVNRDWRMIEAIVEDSFREQKKARRWGIVFKVLTFAYLFLVLFLFYPGLGGSGVSSSDPHVAVVKLEGVIAADQPTSGGRIGNGLRKAFENEKSKAVILAINSPGGSPVQSGYIYDEMMRLRKEYPEKKLYAVIADVGASGGYYVAAAADAIYADKASLIGSIGVTASTFGFVELIDKLGVERRHFTAGEHKAFLDPFSPLREDQKEYWENVLLDIHQQFIKIVTEGRGDRLKMTDDISSGLIWNGEQALEMGLIDGLGGVRFVAREIVGEEELRDYTPSDSPLQALLSKLGVAIGRGVAMQLETNTGIPELR